MIKFKDSRIGYYVVRTKPGKECKDDPGFVLKAHNPEAQLRFERLIREGTERRMKRNKRLDQEIGVIRRGLLPSITGEKK